MFTKGILKSGEYYDSVSLMLIAKKLSEFEEVLDSAILMGTEANIDLLRSSGLLTPGLEKATDSDLLIAFKCQDENNLAVISGKIALLFKKSTTSSSNSASLKPSSIESALEILPGANLALISVAGKYAGNTAMQALRKGLNVMLFSDNVTIEKEIELKVYAREKGLFVMGPDCGTAIINGVPLAFANVVNKGGIGVVAASGTGCQEVTTLISNLGGGISQAIGTGGRDVKKEVGGIMFIEGMKALAEDEKTKVILLVSKPPAPEVIQKIIETAGKIGKPIAAVFLNAKAELFAGSNINIAQNLEEAALLALALLNNQPLEKLAADSAAYELKLNKIAVEEIAKVRKSGKYLRALFSGGTFCDETQLFFQNCTAPVYSNTPVGKVLKSKDLWSSEKHSIIDLGDDDYTVGRPHPMIDFSTRMTRMKAEADDSETAVILFDVVLGYGAHMNPLEELIPVIRKIKENHPEKSDYISLICSVTGTGLDPQNLSEVETKLKQSGVIVEQSNAAASKLAEKIINQLTIYH